MDGDKPDKKWQLGLGGVFLILLMGILLALFVPNKTFGLMGPGDRAKAAVCASHMHQIGHQLSLMANENGSEALKGTTIPDLLREAAHSGELDETLLHCPATGAPYHVLSVPAAQIFLHSENSSPIPIVMDAPGAHSKLGSNVLYSDGSFKLVPPEEAEKILARFSSVPPEIKHDSTPEGSE